VIQIEKVEVGQKFVMENIYYDYDKWDILPESEVELNKLVKVMKDNPSWKVELGSHTDSRGTHEYNETLSQKRSDSAVNYIVSQGISRNRITAKGYGETQPVNECKDGVSCTEEQHQQNRRTEFTILEMD
jgi:outer membrane protein OmpA-like peptidoglycan-associated protein